MRRLSILTLLLAGTAAAQTYNTVTIAPGPTAAAVGRLRFAEKSNSVSRKYLSFEGPDSLGADVRYKFDGTTTAGCLSLGALSGSVYPITTISCGTGFLPLSGGTMTGDITVSGSHSIGASGARWTNVYGSVFDASTGFASLNSASNTVNIPNGGLLALNGTFGSVSNYLVVQGTSPQLNAGSLGGAFNVTGSTTTNGNIVFSPGNVAGNAAVFINTPRLDWPGLIVQNKTGTTTGDVFQILDSAGDAQVRVTGSANTTSPSSLFVGLPTSSLGLVGPSLVVQDVVASLSAPTNASGISMAATPGSGGADLSVFKTGSGTLLPLRFYRNPNEVARFDTGNRFLVGASADDGTGSLVQVNGVVDAVTGFYSNNSASNTVNIPNGGILATNGTFGVSPNYIVVQKTAPQIDASSLGGAFNFNGSSTTNGNIVLNPGNVTGLSSVAINGRSNSNVTTQSLILNELGAATGTGISLKHLGTFDAAWQAGSSAAFDVVSNNASSHRFVVLQNGLVLVARTSDDGTGSIFQVNGAASISGNLTLSGITGSTECLQANSSGVVSGTGSGCSSAPLSFDSNLVSSQTGSVSVNLTVGGGIAPAGFYRVSGHLSCDATGAGSQADVYPTVGATDGATSGTQGISAVSGHSHLQCGSAGSLGTSLLVLPPAFVHTDGTAHITFSTSALGFGGGQSYHYEVFLERLK